MTTTIDAGSKIIPVEGGLGAVPGLRFATAACGIKGEGALDLGLIIADAPLAAAGVFTRNQAAAPPVHLARAALARDGRCQTIVVNSGNANALTGEAGAADAAAIVARVEELFGGPALPLSTGVIGVPLPRAAIIDGLERCQGAIGDDARAFAEAMLTTDTCTKEAARELTLEDGRRIRIGGVAKGSGMIHPDMATMLAVLATDAPMTPRLLDGLLRRVTDETFNRISVDGDTSTNDAVLALAGGGDLPELRAGDPDLPLVEEGLRQVAAELAEQIVADGEGATRLLEVRVIGARWPREAQAIARAIAASPLVKTALHGGDANWGRIIAAACNAGVPLDLEELELTIGEALVFAGGLPRAEDADEADRAFAEERVAITLKVGSGGEEATVLTCDLSADYVAINAHYRS